MKKILEESYTVPAETATENRLYELRAQLAHSLTKEQDATIDQLMNLQIDWVSEASVDGFIQGFFEGLTLMSELYLHKWMVLQSKEE